MGQNTGQNRQVQGGMFGIVSDGIVYGRGFRKDLNVMHSSFWYRAVMTVALCCISISAVRGKFPQEHYPAEQLVIRLVKNPI